MHLSFYKSPLNLFHFMHSGLTCFVEAMMGDKFINTLVHNVSCTNSLQYFDCRDKMHKIELWFLNFFNRIELQEW